MMNAVTAEDGWWWCDDNDDDDDDNDDNDDETNNIHMSIPSSNYSSDIVLYDFQNKLDCSAFCDIYIHLQIVPLISWLFCL